MHDVVVWRNCRARVGGESNRKEADRKKPRVSRAALGAMALADCSLVLAAAITHKDERVIIQVDQQLPRARALGTR
jgi:hypothetical protein